MSNPKGSVIRNYLKDKDALNPRCQLLSEDVLVIENQFACGDSFGF
jgi:hypothetical protein